MFFWKGDLPSKFNGKINDWLWDSGAVYFQTNPLCIPSSASSFQSHCFLRIWKWKKAAAQIIPELAKMWAIQKFPISQTPYTGWLIGNPILAWYIIQNPSKPDGPALIDGRDWFRASPSWLWCATKSNGEVIKSPRSSTINTLRHVEVLSWSAQRCSACVFVFHLSLGGTPRVNARTGVPIVWYKLLEETQSIATSTWYNLVEKVQSEASSIRYKLRKSVASKPSPPKKKKTWCKQQ